MASAKEERDVFDDEEDEDDDDSEEGDDTDEGYDDEDDYEVEAAAPPPKPPAHFSSPFAPSSLDHNANLSPNRNAPPPAPIPQNGGNQPIPIAIACPDGSTDLFTPSPDRKRQRISPGDERRPPSAFDESRRLFQRLWTDEDEIVILQGFLEFTSQRGTTHANYQHDTGPFYDQIKTKLHFEFTKNQLIEKLRRLKKKYRNVVSRMNSGKDFCFKSAHEKAIYDIARNIWSSTFKRPRSHRDNNFPTPQSSNIDAGTGRNGGPEFSDHKISRSQRRIRKRSEEVPTPAMEISTMLTQTPSQAAPPIPSVIEETVRCCLSPMFKELLNYAIGGPSGSVGPTAGLIFGGLPSMNLPQGSGGVAVDEKWRKQQILELEVYLKRVELLEDQIKSTLEELRSKES